MYAARSRKLFRAVFFMAILLYSNGIISYDLIKMIRYHY